jgi:hypothetical protein
MKTARAAMLITCVAALIVVALSPALAVGASTVAATVTPKIISCSVDTANVDFGTLALSGSGTSSAIKVTNDGNVTEKIYVKTSKALNGTGGSWDAPDTGPAANAFGVIADTVPPGTQTVVWETDSLLTTLVSSAFASRTLTLWMPTSTTANGTYSFTVTFTASE